MRRVVLRTDSIELGALLKWVQAVATGGEAKRLIQAGQVRVNGEIERRRGRQIQAGDRVAAGALTLEITRRRT